MVTARYLTNKWVKPLQEKFRQEGRKEGLEEGIEIGVERGVELGRAEGREQGRVEGREQGIELGVTSERQYWLDRERRRLEAEAQGIPFDEPYPDEKPSSSLPQS